MATRTVSDPTLRDSRLAAVSKGEVVMWADSSRSYFMIL